jgi:hypothetical protein
MSESAAETQPVLWCRSCREPVQRSRGTGAAPSTVVHSATGERNCANGRNIADPAAVKPALKEVAARLTGETGGRWRVWADLGGLFAQRADIDGPHVMVDAADEAEMRAKLKARDGIIKWAQIDAAARSAVQP